MIRKITIVASHQNSFLSYAISQSLLESGICKEVGTAGFEHLQQNEPAHNTYFEYIMVVLNKESESLLRTILTRAVPDRRTFIFLTLQHLPYEEIKKYYKKCDRLAVIDHTASSYQLKTCIEELYIKNYVLSPNIQNRILLSMDHPQNIAELHFTGLENKILEMHRKGYDVALTAKLLNLKKHKVQSHRSRIIKKCGARSMKEVTDILNNQTKTLPCTV